MSSTTLDLKSILGGGLKNAHHVPLQIPLASAMTLTLDTTTASPLNSKTPTNNQITRPRKRKKMEQTRSQSNIKNFFECVVEMLKKNEGKIAQGETIPEEPELKLPKEVKKIIKNLGDGMLKLTGLSPS